MCAKSKQKSKQIFKNYGNGKRCKTEGETRFRESINSSDTYEAYTTHMSLSQGTEENTFEK